MFASQQTAPDYFAQLFLRASFENSWQGMLFPAHRDIALLKCQSAEVREALLEAFDYAKMYHSNE